MRDSERAGPEGTDRETWSERVRGFIGAARSLLATRMAILREELGAKGEALARAVIALLLAAAFAGLALLLFTAWIAAVLSRLLGGPVAGILAAFLLYAAVAAIAGVLGGKALARVRPFDFPVTAEEVRKDLEALRRSAAPEPPGPPVAEADTEVVARPTATDDLEARFRAGSE